MAIRIITGKKREIVYNITDFSGAPSFEEIDLRTSEGKQRYKERFGCEPNSKGTNIKIRHKPCDNPPASSGSVRFLSRIYNERDRRLFAGFLSKGFGRGGVRKAARLTGLDVKTVRKGKRELKARSVPENGRIRREGGGRPTKAQEEPRYEQGLQALLEPEMAGNPQDGRIWVRKTLRWMKKELQKKKIYASISTIRKTLKKFHISLKKCVKSKSSRSKRHPDRETQFQYIHEFKRTCEALGVPIISVDTKKKENIGNFKNDGKTWRKEAIEVFDHDFPSLGEGKLIPYGIYDLTHNEGHVYCGTTHDTSKFAVDSICRWWEEHGQFLYPDQSAILILCDSGGSNGYRRRAWKWELQTKLADRLGLTVHVCHYPSGASKYNPIERKLFSFISKNWAGEPLTSYEKALNFMRTTTTETGLEVTASLVEKEYETGVKVSDEQMDSLRIKKAAVCPRWNYCIRPR